MSESLSTTDYYTTVVWYRSSVVAYSIVYATTKTKELQQVHNKPSVPDHRLLSMATEQIAQWLKYIHETRHAAGIRLHFMYKPCIDQ